jgi:hypothetical protein
MPLAFQSIFSYSELMQRHPERREEMVQAISRNATRGLQIFILNTLTSINTTMKIHQLFPQ